MADNFVGGVEGAYWWFLGLDNNLGVDVQGKVELLHSWLHNYCLLKGDDRLVRKDGTDDFSMHKCYTKILEARLKYFNEGVVRYNWESSVWPIICNRVPTQIICRKNVYTCFALCTCARAEEGADHHFCTCNFTS